METGTADWVSYYKRHADDIVRVSTLYAERDWYGRHLFYGGEPHHDCLAILIGGGVGWRVHSPEESYAILRDGLLQRMRLVGVVNQ